MWRLRLGLGSGEWARVLGLPWVVAERVWRFVIHSESLSENRGLRAVTSECQDDTMLPKWEH